MKKFLVLLLVAAVAIFAASATATPPSTVLAHHFLGNGSCQESQKLPSAVDNHEWILGACPSIPNGDPPTVTNNPTGWPATTGTLEGDTSKPCDSPVVLNSTSSTYGAFNFDVAAGTTFENLGLTFDLTYLSGSTYGGGSPRISVFLANGHTWFVYAYDVNPGGDVQNYENFTANPNTYLTRIQAMATADHSQVVTGASLVVDGGWLAPQHVQVNGVTADGCTAPVVKPVIGKVVQGPNTFFLCHPNGGFVPGAYILSDAVRAVKDGWTLPYAMPNSEGIATADILGDYNLVCNPAAHGFPGAKPTGNWIGLDGTGFGDPSYFGHLGTYPIAN